jgi:hypothetical protein
MVLKPVRVHKEWLSFQGIWDTREAFQTSFPLQSAISLYISSVTSCILIVGYSVQGIPHSTMKLYTSFHNALYVDGRAQCSRYMEFTQLPNSASSSL